MKFDLYYLVLSLVGTILGTSYTNRLENGQFLYLGDQFYRFNFYEVLINSFFLRKLENFGVHNGWQFMTQFWDVLYYLLVYSVGINFILAEKILFIILLLFTLNFSYFGFKKINQLLGLKISRLNIFVITLWYCFNPYTLSLWHGGVYSLGAALTYSLAPVTFYVANKALFGSFRINYIIICSVLLFVSSFTFWIFAPLALILLMYVILFLIFSFNLERFLNLLKNGSLLLLLYLLLASPILFSIFFEFFNNAGDNNADFTPTYTNQLGGLKYQFLMLFSWGIYNIWTPRTIYPFYHYYFSSTYIVATIGLYILVGVGFLADIFKSLFNSIKKGKNFVVPIFNKDNSIAYILLLLFFISIFFAKAAQPPLGEIFVYLYENIPIFSVFRTPDIRFGFTAVLCLAILLIYVANFFNKYLFAGLIMVIIYFQSIFLLNGLAIYGENNQEGFLDRIIYIPTDYIQVVNTINTSSEFGYILPFPSVDYGLYKIDSSEQHLGQDLLPKFTINPFSYLSVSNGMNKQTYSSLTKAIYDRDYSTINQYPIRYILLRNDLSCDNCLTLPKDSLEKQFKKILENNTFSLFQVLDAPSIVVSRDSSYLMTNPTKFKVNLQYVKEPQQLSLLLSYDKNWRIYLEQFNEINCTNKKCSSKPILFEGDELRYLYSQSRIDSSHSLYSDYANGWVIDSTFIKDNYDSSYYTENPDGSLNLNVTIFYQPQSLLYLTLFISFLTLIIIAFYFLNRNYNAKIKLFIKMIIDTSIIRA